MGWLGPKYLLTDIHTPVFDCLLKLMLMIYANE